MDFTWTDEQETFRASVRRFAQRELNDNLVGRDAGHEFPRDLWKKCAEVGLLGLPVPEAYGGSGADPLTIVAALEALGYGCRDNGLIFSLNAQLWSCVRPIVDSGSDEQKRRYLPSLCDGTIMGVQAMTEPGSGSDSFGMATTAVSRGDSFLLNGTKTFITNAPVADVFVVFAATDRAKGFAGISAFLVDRDRPGLTVGQPFRKMGLRTSPMAEVSFGDCEIPASSLLGPVGAGAAIFNNSMDWERGFILASAVGTMQRQLERCVAYGRQRKQFGQSISKFQSVANRIVDMGTRLKCCRLMLYELAWLKSTGKSTALESAMVKLQLSEAFVQSSMDAMFIHGAYGYMQESEFEREVRDALGSRIYSGTSDIQRNIIAGRMRL